MKSLSNFIDGKFQAPLAGSTSEIINPATGQAYTTAPVSGSADVDAAMVAAERAFPDWRDSTPSERSRALLKIADAI
jgi:betaine-aldehyde dehydrogenase